MLLSASFSQQTPPGEFCDVNIWILSPVYAVKNCSTTRRSTSPTPHIRQKQKMALPDHGSPPRLTPQELIKVMCEWDSTLAPLTDRQRELCLGLQYMTFDAAPASKEHAPGKTSLTGSTAEQAEDRSMVVPQPEATQLEIDMEHFVKQGEQMLQVVNSIHDKANSTLAALHCVSQEFREAWNKMNSIYETCEKLEEEKKRLLVAADSIKDRLEPFQALEQVTIKMHSTSIKTTSHEFIQQLARLAANIKFLHDNSQFKEAEDFLDRYTAVRSHAFQRIMSDCDAALDNALPLVPTVEVVEDFSQPRRSDVAGASGGRSLPFDVALCEEQLFAKFRADTTVLQPLYAEIERLATIPGLPEFSTLLNQLKQSFCTKREKLSSQLVTVLLRRLVAKHSRDICQFGRSGCALLVRICCDEWNLFHSYFRRVDVQNDALDYYLSRLCERFYEAIRPQILNCSHVEQLSQLCIILASEAFAGYAAERKQECAVFSHVTGQIVLSDVQERLVYRANVYINDQIAQYKASAGDLAYPEKLIVMQDVVDDMLLPATVIDDDNMSTISNATDIERRLPPQLLNHSISMKSTSAGSTVSGSFVSHSRTPADLPGLWYPPVRRTLTLIKRLSQSVDVLTFRNLTHEAISACLASLEQAASMIRNQTNKKGAIENSYLFYIKHVMILREAVMMYHAVDFSIEQTDLDFQSPIKRFAAEFFARQQQQNAKMSSAVAAVFASQSLAHVLQSLVTSHSLVEERQTRTDARIAIDDALRTACRVLIDIVCQMLVGPVRVFLDKADAVLRTAPPPALPAAVSAGASSDGSAPAAAAAATPVVRLGEHSFASAVEVHDLLRAFQERLCARLGPLHRLLRLYMGETPSFTVLFRAIFDRIMSNAVQMQRLVTHAYNDAEREVIQCPSATDIAQLMMKICTAVMHATNDDEVFSSASLPPPPPTTSAGVTLLPSAAETVAVPVNISTAGGAAHDAIVSQTIPDSAQ